MNKIKTPRELVDAISEFKRSMDNEFKIPKELVDAISELADRAKLAYDSWLPSSVDLSFELTNDLLERPEKMFIMGWIDGYVARQWDDVHKSGGTQA